MVVDLLSKLGTKSASLESHTSTTNSIISTSTSSTISSETPCANPSHNKINCVK